jgi:hypothetical protein
MQPSTLNRSPEKSASPNGPRQPRMSIFKAMDAIERGERRTPAPAELPHALEQRLRALERDEVLRQFLRVLAWVGSLLVLEGDVTPRD